MLEIKNITKIYGAKNGFKALDDVSINFGSRGLVVVLGKSGCGKSTLLNIIGGLDSATRGEVVINGRSTKSFRSSDFDSYRNTFVGIVFQEFNLIDEISVYDNINMTMNLQEKNADVNTVDEVLEMVGLGNLGYRKPSELSGGQRQRVALARALLKNPEIILADEPTGALDSVTGEGVFETLKRLALEKLVVVVTHNKDLANAYADRIIEISDGKIIGDRMREQEAYGKVRELTDGVIEVSAGGSVNAEQLNARLKKGEINYIGIGHEKDRIALAYPETVETFYESAAKTEFNDTRKEDIPSDSKPFRLSKGKFRVRDSVKHAKAGMKRMKKRYRFLVVVTSICFTFFALALMMGMVSMPSLVAKSSFDTGSQPFVSVAALTQGEYPSKKFTNSEEKTAAEQLMGCVGAGEYKLRANPMFASGGLHGMNRYIMESFDAVLEMDDAADFNMRLSCGNGVCESTDEIIISDYAAWVLCKLGYIGYDASGKYSVLYPDSEEDILGTRLCISQSDTAYKIVGIYKTDYEDYLKVLTSSLYQIVDETLSELLYANMSFMYCKIIGAKGFAAQYRIDAKDSYDSDNYYYVLLSRTDGIYNYNYPASVAEMRYDKNTFESFMLWSAIKNGDGEYVAPDSLADDEMVVMYNVIADNVGYYGEEPEKLPQQSGFDDAVAQTYTVTIRQNGSGMVSKRNMKVVGVMLPRENDISLLGDGLLSELNVGDACDSVYFPRGAGRIGLEGKLSKLGKSGFTYGNAAVDCDTILFFGSFLKEVGGIFVVIAIVLLVLAFLTILNYISASIRFRAKEIAVYRVIGAKPTDIMRMFIAEGGFIAVTTSIIAIILSLIVSSIINSFLITALSVMGLGISIVNFNWLVHPIVIVCAAVFTVVISSVIPLLKVTTKRPIEAVKMI